MKNLKLLYQTFIICLIAVIFLDILFFTMGYHETVNVKDYFLTIPCSIGGVVLAKVKSFFYE